MRKHSIDQTAAWAKSWGVKGLEHLYPENREKRRQEAVVGWLKRNKDREDNQQRKR